MFGGKRYQWWKKRADIRQGIPVKKQQGIYRDIWTLPEIKAWLMNENLNSTQIAQKIGMNVSPSNVRYHRNKLRKKMI